MDVQRTQLIVCERFGQTADFPTADSKCGVAANVGTGQVPLNGLRHPPDDGTSGWFLWAGETWSDAADFFQPLHYWHLSERAPSILPYLALPPGWRFLIADGYEDVWFDSSLLAPD